MATEEFVVQVDIAVASAARAAARLHGLDIQLIVSRLVNGVLEDYAEKVRSSVPKPDFGDRTAALTEDDIPF